MSRASAALRSAPALGAGATLVSTALFDEVFSGSVYVFERSGDAWVERGEPVLAERGPARDPLRAARAVVGEAAARDRPRVGARGPLLLARRLDERTLRGVAYQGTRIPLNMDAYFRALVRHPNEGLFTNNFGVLDANGRAELVLKVPLDSYADWSGLKLDHAFVEYGPGGFEHVSNAAALRFGDRR